MKIEIAHIQIKKLIKSIKSISPEVPFEIRFKLAEIGLLLEAKERAFNNSLKQPDLTAYNTAVEALSKHQDKLSEDEYITRLNAIDKNYAAKLKEWHKFLNESNIKAENATGIEFEGLTKKEIETLVGLIKQQEILINLVPILKNE